MTDRRLYRVDRGNPAPLTVLKTPQANPNGKWLRVEGFSSRAGIYEYPQADGSVRREWRPWEWLTHPETLASMQGCPVTHHHPTTPDGHLSADDVSRYTKGSTHASTPVPDTKSIASTLDLYHARVIEAVQGGQDVELSWVYRVTGLDETPGTTPDGEPYDAIQVGPYIHDSLAVVDTARGGDTLRIRLDAAGAITLGGANVPTPDTTPTGGHMLAYIKKMEKEDGGDSDKYAVMDMMGEKLDEYDSEEEALEKADAINAELTPEQLRAMAAKMMEAKSDMDDPEGGPSKEDMAKELDEAKADMEHHKADAAKARKDAKAAQTRVETLQGRYDALKAKGGAPDKTRVDSAAKARLDLIARALPLVAHDQRAQLMEMGDDAIMRATIQAVHPHVKLDSKGADYLGGMFEALTEGHTVSMADLMELRVALGGGGKARTDSADDPADDNGAADHFATYASSYENGGAPA